MTTSGTGLIVCPFDGEIHRVAELESVSDQTVVAEFDRRSQLGLRSGEFEEVRSISEPPTGAPESRPDLSWIGSFQKQEGLLDAISREVWFRLPCAIENHFLPERYVTAALGGKASIVALAGLPGSGKTHLLTAIARSLGTNSLARGGLPIEHDTFRPNRHWQMFNREYVTPLFEEGKARPLTAHDALPYTSLLVEVREVGDAEGGEWLAVVDCAGEASLPQNLPHRGRYLASADTVVICLDGDLVLASLEGHAGGQLAINEEPALTGAGLMTFEYASSLAQYLSADVVRRHRRSLGQSPFPNVAVVVTKGDLILRKFRDHGLSIADRFEVLANLSPREELDMGFVWERHRQVVALLVAAGLEPVVSEIARLLPHPIYAFLSATGSAAAISEDGDFVFERVEPQNVDFVVVNHLVSQGYLRAQVQGSFGPR
ncbi:MAG: hypothetical protein AAF962_27195 [Actinomycetota bacterium]